MLPGTECPRAFRSWAAQDTLGEVVLHEQPRQCDAPGSCAALSLRFSTKFQILARACTVDSQADLARSVLFWPVWVVSTFASCSSLVDVWRWVASRREPQVARSGVLCLALGHDVSVLCELVRAACCDSDGVHARDPASDRSAFEGGGCCAPTSRSEAGGGVQGCQLGVKCMHGCDPSHGHTAAQRECR